MRIPPERKKRPPRSFPLSMFIERVEVVQRSYQNERSGALQELTAWSAELFLRACSDKYRLVAAVVAMQESQPSRTKVDAQVGSWIYMVRMILMWWKLRNTGAKSR
jgi:hypothetical protein